MGIERFDEHFA